MEETPSCILPIFSPIKSIQKTNFNGKLVSKGSHRYDGKEMLADGQNNG